jgi:tetraacyldisaccharide 4'-kinase
MTPLERAARGRLTRAWDTGTPPLPATVAAVGYRGLLHAREWLYRRRILESRPLPCGVVSIGNLTVGGTGKTPAVVLAVETLKELGARPAVVSRGYGRRSRGLVVVADGNAIRARADEAGDEPLLLARRLPGTPVVVSEKRYEGARHALTRLGATTVVLDDGFQHRSLVKHAEIVLARADNPWGNGRLFPAGPLREPLDALRRATLIVVIGPRRPAASGEVEAARDRWAPGVPVVHASHEADTSIDVRRGEAAPPTVLAGRRLVGFAGIGHPGGFRSTLAGLGVEVAGFHDFPDHYRYRRQDIDALLARLGPAGAEALVTTEKDWMRLAEWVGRTIPLYVVTIRTVLSSGEARWRSVLREVAR